MREKFIIAMGFLSLLIFIFSPNEWLTPLVKSIVIPLLILGLGVRIYLKFVRKKQ